jgi:hypothetical protein
MAHDAGAGREGVLSDGARWRGVERRMKKERPERSELTAKPRSGPLNIRCAAVTRYSPAHTGPTNASPASIRKATRSSAGAEM